MYKIGDIVDGKVTGIEDYGIFVVMDDETIGLIHISEVSHFYVKNIYDCAKVGDKIKVEVIGVNEDGERLKLSIKNLKNNRNGRFVKIRETKSGFSTLENNLDIWINSKLK